MSWSVESLGAPQENSFDADVETEIRLGFLKTYLADAPHAWLASSVGCSEVRREIVEKYQQCLEYVVPWVERVAPLRGQTLVEIGCGTGAKSAAFAEKAKVVLACDQSEPHVRAAESRIAAMDIDNVELTVGDADTFLGDLERRLPPRSVGVCLFFAVLEHMTLEERLSTLGRAWGLLAPGGLLVVLESPNRLLPWDWHSSRLPFFNMLPDDLASRYYDRSPRPDFVNAVRQAEPAGEDAVALALTRQGRGVSYHEFELALGADFGRLLVADSWDLELVALNPVHPDETHLVDFVRREEIDVPAAFTRYWIELILRRPGATPDESPPGLPHPLGSTWQPQISSAGGDPLPLPRDSRQAIFVVEASDAGELSLSDDRDQVAVVRVPAGRSVHRVPVTPGSKVLHVRGGPNSPLAQLAFAR